jgi:hypothetical protein
MFAKVAAAGKMYQSLNTIQTCGHYWNISFVHVQHQLLSKEFSVKEACLFDLIVLV